MPAAGSPEREAEEVEAGDGDGAEAATTPSAEPAEEAEAAEERAAVKETAAAKQETQTTGPSLTVRGESQRVEVGGRPCLSIPSSAARERERERERERTTLI